MSKTVTVFSTTYCATCKQLKKWLDSKGVAYDAVNLEEHPERQAEVLQKSGTMSVPVSFITDSEDSDYFKVIAGPNYGEFTSELNLA